MENIPFDTPSEKWNIVRLDAHNLKDVASLYTAVYGHPPKKGMLKKKYETEYTGHTYLGYIAYTEEGDVAAYYGVVPCFLSFERGILPAAQSVDTMTHPHHNRKGLFPLLAKQTYQLCSDEGIKLIFGFPNQNSHPTFINKLGWKYLEHMDLFILSVKTFPLLGKLIRPFSKYFLKKLPVQGLPNHLLMEGFAGLLRDEEFLQYRAYHTTYVIAAGEARAWIRIGASLIVGDVEVKEDQFDGMLKALKRLAKKLGIDNISFQVSPGTALHTMLARHHQPRSAFPVIIKDLGAGLPHDRIKFTFADTDIF